MSVARSLSNPRTRTIATTAGCAVWFGANVIARSQNLWSDGTAMAIAGAGLFALFIAHIVQTGDHTLVALALCVLPALVFLVSWVPGELALGLVCVGVGSLLTLASMSGAARVRSRFGERRNSGGDGGFSGFDVG